MILKLPLPFLLLITYIGYSQTEINQISGSLETNNIYYLNDSLINAQTPKDKIGSNSYFKIDYRRGDFAAGIQYEAYLPPLLGYSPLLEGNGVVNRFASYQNKLISITAGNFYEQFGSGLIFRAYEERSLGISTILDGISLKLNPSDYLQIKTFSGKQRKYFELGDANIRGADFEVQLSQLFIPESPLALSIGGSWVNKHEKYTGPATNIPLAVNAFAGRIQMNYKNYSFYAEYVQKGKDPAFVNLYSNGKGSATLLNQSFSLKGFGIVLSLRRLENIDFRSERDEMGNSLTLNYLPSLTKQHKYTLANLHPYSSRSKGEMGGQFDVFYKFDKGSVIGGSSGLKIAGNFSTYYSLDNKNQKASYTNIGDTLLFRDLSVEVEKKISSKIKSSITYVNQQYNKGAVLGGNETIKEQIVVLDVNYKFSPKTSAKFEISELWGIKGEDDWSLLLAEFSFVPKWTVFISDMIQHKENDVHYYKGGLSYNQSSTKISLAFGRSREGLQCVSGMCRFMPAYTGINLSLITSF